MSWRALLAVGIVSLGVACGKATERGGEEETPTAASSAGGTVKPKPAPVVHRIDIDDQRVVRVDGEIRGTTRAIVAFGRLQKIDELHDSVKPHAGKDVVHRLTCVADVSGGEYTSAILTLREAGIAAVEVETSGGPVRVEPIPATMAENASAGRPLSEGQYGILVLEDPVDTVVSWHGAGAVGESPIARGEPKTPYRDALLAAWKQHPQASVLLISPGSRLRWDDFTALVQSAHGAREAVAPSARIVIGRVPAQMDPQVSMTDTARTAFEGKTSTGLGSATAYKIHLPTAVLEKKGDFGSVTYKADQLEIELGMVLAKTLAEAVKDIPAADRLREAETSDGYVLATNSTFGVKVAVVKKHLQCTAMASSFLATDRKAAATWLESLCASVEIK